MFVGDVHVVELKTIKNILEQVLGSQQGQMSEMSFYIFIFIIIIFFLKLSSSLLFSGVTNTLMFTSSRPLFYFFNFYVYILKMVTA